MRKINPEYVSIVSEATSASPYFKLVNFLSATNGTKLIAHGKKIKLGRTLGYGQANVTDENGKTLAHGSSTLMVIQNLSFKLAEPLPPKFL